jgi:hypothetical protein
MKNSILLSVLVLLMSCAKEIDTDKYDKFISKEGWYLDKQIRTALDNPNEIYDDYSTLSECHKKDLRYYKKGGEYEFVNGCDNSTVIGTWSFNSDETSFTVNIQGGSIEYHIEEFTRARLKVYGIDTISYNKPYIIERELINYLKE